MLARNARRYTSEGMSLRDDILRDTVAQLVAHPGEPGQKFVIESLKTYIENIHHQGLSADLLACWFLFTTCVTRNKLTMK